MYEHTTKNLISEVLNGYSATVFAYGATGMTASSMLLKSSLGSGKTHTMIGNQTGGPGVMVLTMRDLFEMIEQNKSEKKIKVSISYLEVYPQRASLCLL